jgi:hypothetical protein
MTARVIGSGQWAPEGILTMTTQMTNSVDGPAPVMSARSSNEHVWSVGQIVDVRPRTWAG